MPRTFMMTWVPARKGWMKWHRGHSYSVSCRQLGTEPTKEASWLAANEWWQEKEAELREQATAPDILLDPASQSIKDILDRFSVRDLRRLAGRGEAARKLLDILDRASVDGIPTVDGRGPLPLPSELSPNSRKVKASPAISSAT